ncbi:hypothetical protein L798_05654 [Zootermopsis nevadensis]|uniref:Uncharacterized protein n=1 Tax=Zootermopsis nevadensis TaxID=136037 RepID=A0A067R9C0_ZOONE|nr:hypothetical protein L798_05654 [Zootermopsis nevadensis]
MVIDNASYQNTQADKPPTSYSKKDEMKAWLLERNTPFCDVLKAQPYDLIKLNESKHKYYVIDQILADKERTVLRLSPYHPDLNPRLTYLGRCKPMGCKQEHNI